jgi:hypothetical protein
MIHRAIARRLDCSESQQTTGVHECAACELASTDAQIFDIERKIKVAVPQRGEVFGPRADDLNYLQRGTSRWLLAAEPISAVDEQSIAQVKPSPGTPNGHGLTPGETLKADLHMSPQLVRLQTNLQAPGLLVFRSTWLPGWQVRTDGAAWREPLCANRWMLCAPIDAGQHQVEFRYRPVALNASIIICLLAWLTAGGLLLYRQRP